MWILHQKRMKQKKQRNRMVHGFPASKFGESFRRIINREFIWWVSLYVEEGTLQWRQDNLRMLGLKYFFLIWKNRNWNYPPVSKICPDPGASETDYSPLEMRTRKKNPMKRSASPSQGTIKGNFREGHREFYLKI